MRTLLSSSATNLLRGMSCISGRIIGKTSLAVTVRDTRSLDLSSLTVLTLIMSVGLEVSLMELSITLRLMLSSLDPILA